MNTRKKAVIVTAATKMTYEDVRLCKEMQLVFDDVEVMHQDEMSRWHLESTSMIAVRTGAASTNRTIEICERLYEDGIAVCNPPVALRHGRDKALQAKTLESHGLPTPMTIPIDNSTDVDHITEALGEEFVIKCAAGTCGDGVFFHRADERARRCIDVNLEVGRELIAQKLVQGGSRDFRILVCDGRVIAAMRRCAVKGERRANASKGAQCTQWPIYTDMADLALDVAAAMEMHIAGVDLIRDGDSWSVLEANAAPGFRFLDRALRRPLAWRGTPSVSREMAACMQRLSKSTEQVHAGKQVSR